MAAGDERKETGRGGARMRRRESSVRDKVIPMKRFLIACGPVASIGASTSPLLASPTAGSPGESSHALAVAFRNGLQQAGVRADNPT